MIISKALSPPEDVLVWNLKRHGAPIPYARGPRRELTVEDTLAYGLLLARKHPQIAMVWPIVYAKEARLGLMRMESLARSIGQGKTLGFFLALMRRLLGKRKATDVETRLRKERPKASEYFLISRMDSLHSELTRRRTPRIAKDWGFWINTKVEDFRSTFTKHMKSHVEAKARRVSIKGLSKFWITEAGVISLLKPPLPLDRCDWIGVLRGRWKLTFTARRLTAGTMNRIASFLSEYPKAGKTAKLIFLQPRTSVTWPVMDLSRRRYSERLVPTMKHLRWEIRSILPECKPRKGRKSSPFFDALRAWLAKHRYFHSGRDYAILGPDGGVLAEAENAPLPADFSFVGEPIWTKKHGGIIRLKSRQEKSWRGFIDKITAYIRSFGHENTFIQPLIERGYVRIQFLTAGLRKNPCIHAGELQIEGLGVVQAIKDHKDAETKWKYLNRKLKRASR